MTWLFIVTMPLSDAAREFESDGPQSEADERGSQSEGGGRGRAQRLSKFFSPTSYAYGAMARPESEIFVYKSDADRYLLEQRMKKGPATRATKSTQQRRALRLGLSGHGQG